MQLPVGGLRSARYARVLQRYERVCAGMREDYNCYIVHETLYTVFNKIHDVEEIICYLFFVYHTM